ncbi:MAG: dTDP-4-dehydrorhamnose reductase [Pirellulales bacterium]|nr:dTDP-4-dehydrorhamnose reductase [Pirellulales bacterium]
MRPIAVTGALGQLGSELCRQIGADAVGLDLPHFNLTARRSVLDRLGEIRPRAVINTAAYTGVDQAQREPDRCRAINAGGVAHLADACRRIDAVLVQISTDYVFGGDAARRSPYRETDPPAPQGVYAATKLEGERSAAACRRHFVVRTCGLYGHPGPRSPGNFVETMLRLARERDHLRVVDDQLCTPSYVVHVAAAVRFLLSTDRYGTYHVVNTGETTWYRFAEAIFQIAGIRIALEPVTTAQYGLPAPRPAYSVLDTAKYHSLPGSLPMPPWRDALRKYLDARQDLGPANE